MCKLVIMKFSTRKLNWFGWLFLVFGLFILGIAILVAAQEALFNKNGFSMSISMINQLIITGIFCMLSGIFLLERSTRGIILGLVTSGILIFLSIVIIFENNLNTTNSSLWNILPAIFLIFISFAFIFRVMKNTKQF